MRHPWRRLGLVALLIGLTPGAARANIFFPPTPPGLSGDQAMRLKRLLIGAYFAQWDVAGFGPTSGIKNPELDASPSPLVTLDYFLNDHLSIGGWYNPVSLEGKTNGRTFLEGDAQFSDFHITYYLPHGWSAQAGFSHISEELEATRDVFGVEPGTIAVPKGRRFESTKNGANLWVTKTQRVKGGRHPVMLYASFGYYPSDDFDNAYNAIVGGSVKLLPNVNFSGSVWFFNLQEKVETRTSVGIVGRF